MADIAYKIIKKSMDAAALRQKVIANNLANINTKGFKRSEVAFEEILRKEIKNSGGGLSRIESLEPQIIKDESTSMRSDGNNVDIDIEMSNMAANNILYNTLVTQLNTKLSTLRYVINGGR